MPPKKSLKKRLVTEDGSIESLEERKRDYELRAKQQFAEFKSNKTKKVR